MVSAAKLCGGAGEHEMTGESPTRNLLHPSEGRSGAEQPWEPRCCSPSPPSGRQGWDAQEGSAPGCGTTEDAQGMMLKDKTPKSLVMTELWELQARTGIQLGNSRHSRGLNGWEWAGSLHRCSEHLNYSAFLKSFKNQSSCILLSFTPGHIKTNSCYCTETLETCAYGITS